MGFEATYFPTGVQLNPSKIRPIRQRFGVNQKGSNPGPAVFLVASESPVYLGTIQVDNAHDGIVYRGHYLQVVDDYDNALERIQRIYPILASSLKEADIDPVRQFALKPLRLESPLEVIELDEPIRQARSFISDGKYRQAVNWLRTFMPATDVERVEAGLLIGEALLGYKKIIDAIDSLRRVVQSDPENSRALRLLARAHAMNGDLEDAQGLYEALAELLPSDPEAHLQLGYYYAVNSQASRSAQEFTTAFEMSSDYLLHDLLPFTVALKAAKLQLRDYSPPELRKLRGRIPKSLRSRRGAEEAGGIALVIDHRGKVVAAHVAPDSSGAMPVMMMAMIRSTFKPASLNGVDVPALVILGGRGSRAGNSGK